MLVNSFSIVQVVVHYWAPRWEIAVCIAHTVMWNVHRSNKAIPVVLKRDLTTHMATSNDCQARNLWQQLAEVSAQDVKRAYRKLVSQYHPDKLSSQGLPDEIMDMAKRRVYEINTAYNRIKSSRKRNSMWSALWISIHNVLRAWVFQRLPDPNRRLSWSSTVLFPLQFSGQFYLIAKKGDESKIYKRN